jgi:hypothetical protein
MRAGRARIWCCSRGGERSLQYRDPAEAREEAHGDLRPARTAEVAPQVRRTTGNGCVLGFGGTSVYISGPTGSTPEMQALGRIDIAFLCMNLPYAMTDADAAKAVASFQPKIVCPYNDRGNVLGIFRFKKALAGMPVGVRIRNWYE